MDKKTIIATATAAAVTLVVTLGLTWLFATTEAGIDAADKANIEAVVKEMLVTDTGTTHSAALAQINLSLNSISTKVVGIEDDIDDIRLALRELARQRPTQ